jgi:hypothetical protein
MGDILQAQNALAEAPNNITKMSFSSNNGAKNNWQQPVNSNVPPDIVHTAKGPRNPSLNIPTMAHTAMDTVRPEEATHDFSINKVCYILILYIHLLFVIEIACEGALDYYLPSHMYAPTPA